MNRGYTKRWRKRWDKGYHKDRLLWIMMSYFIDFAAYKDKEVFKKDVGKIKLLRGEWYFTYRELAKFMAVNPRRIRTCISTLSKMGFLTLKPTRQYTIVLVNKYDTYQPLEILKDTHTDTNPTQGRHRVDTPLIKDTKKVKKVKNTNNRTRAWPNDFILTDKKKSYAIENGIDPNKVVAFFDDFKDWSLSKGATYKDWDAAFRTRVRKAEEYGKHFLKAKTYEQEIADKKFQEYERIMKL